MRTRILQLLGATVLAEALAAALFLPSCGVLSSGQCAEKATCEQPEVGAPPNQPDVSIAPTDTQAVDSSDAAAADVASDTRADAVSEKPSIDVAKEIPDAGHDAGSIDANIDMMEAALEDTTVDAGVDASFDAFEDVPADAIYMGDTAACGPCDNVCIPSFVPCCIGDGGCGCIEFFFPVSCQ